MIRLRLASIFAAHFLLLLLPYTVRADGVDQARKVTLPNGVRLILKPESTSEAVAISVFVRMQRDTMAYQDAIGEMVANALWYGTDDRTGDWVAFSVGQVGGSLETLRTPDYVSTTCITSPGRIDDAINTLCDTLKHADFTPEALSKGYRDILRGRRLRAENSFATATERASELIDATEEPPEQLLRSVTQQQAQDYFKAKYVPAQTVIAVTGRFDLASIQTDFETALYDFTRRSPSHPDLDLPQDPQPHLQPISEIHLPGSVAYALVAVSSPRVDSPDYPAFRVLHALLGTGHASRLFRRLRDRLGLGYSVGASYRADLAAPLIAHLQWDPTRPGTTGNSPTLKPVDAIHRLNEQLDNVLSDPPTDAELTRARNIAISQDSLLHERIRDRAFLPGWYETMGIGFEYDADFAHRLEQVSRDDVLRVARKYLAVRSPVVALP